MSEPLSLPSRADREAERMKVPPHSLEAEQSVLGGMMIDSAHFEEVSALINADDFYIAAHRVLFEAIAHLHQHERPYDAISVVDYLQSSQKLEEIGGKRFIVELVKATPGSANVLHYARIVREKAIQRQLIAACNEIIEQAYFPGELSMRDLLDMAETRILAIAEHGSDREREYMAISDLLTEAVNHIEKLFQSDSPITGIATHYPDLDEMTAGLQPGDLIIVAGRPSMGKTTFSINIAENIATLGRQPVAIFSLEMPGEQLVMRMLSSIGRIPSQRIRTGKLEGEDWSNLSRAVAVLSEANIFIDDTPALSVNELRARARRIDKEVRDAQKKAAQEKGVPEAELDAHITGLQLIVIDYLQLMRGSANAENRVNEISEISRGLKALAKELNIPVIALSQLNRSLEQRPDKRPRMSDLRESGAIEQDADLIMFIYRDEVYNPDTDRKGVAEIIIGKHRNGPIGTVLMTFIGEYTRFESYVPVEAVEGSDSY
ncbi:replicative DNA helicase [Sulfurivirga sp.]|uniref:replicative DNA helicase n=1 Tax=Sulfurivirga sp. TaxID=2614236 RepID=UPI0025D1D93D|nr:replicative DNA helicase [Sulfurivirga sp.]